MHMVYSLNKITSITCQVLFIVFIYSGVENMQLYFGGRRGGGLGMESEIMEK